MSSDTPAAGATARYHHGDLFEALAAEALDQVRSRGTDAVSLRGVAQAVGVSASAAYHHFPDKTALLVEVAHRGNAELDRRSGAASAAVAGAGLTAAVARMRAIGAAYIQFAGEDPHLFRHVFGFYCDVSMSGEIPQGSNTYQLLCETLDEMERLGGLRRREGLDMLAWTSVHGFASLMIDQLLPPEAAGANLDALLGIILTDPP
jgi:AcrR family transcriptional regulator